MEFDNKEQKDALVRIALAAYLGESCICGHKFETIEELGETVWFPHDTGRIVHKKCYDNRKKEKIMPKTPKEKAWQHCEKERAELSDPESVPDFTKWQTYLINEMLQVALDAERQLNKESIEAIHLNCEELVRKAWKASADIERDARKNAEDSLRNELGLLRDAIKQGKPALPCVDVFIEEFDRIRKVK